MFVRYGSGNDTEKPIINLVRELVAQRKLISINLGTWCFKRRIMNENRLNANGKIDEENNLVQKQTIESLRMVPLFKNLSISQTCRDAEPPQLGGFHLASIQFSIILMEIENMS